MGPIRIIDWNVCFIGNSTSKIAYLDQMVGTDDCIVMLQEVKPDFLALMREHFGSRLEIAYSLDYRPVGKFDPDSRKLGVAICVTSSISIVSAQTLDRSPFPDRTLMVTADLSGQRITIMSLHSVTGCDYGRAKSVQFFSFAEAVETYRPDIVGIDANECDVDSLDPSKSVYFDNYDHGNGASTFFGTMHGIGLVDSYRHGFSRDKNPDEFDLAYSHIVKGRNPRRKRYDFMYVNQVLIPEFTFSYLFEDAVHAGSDHAILILNS